jgi:dipeptidyl aminopeptidase/acylaminoacyl peptidase
MIPSKGGDVKKLLGGFDYDPQGPFWSNNSEFIYFRAQVGVNKQPFSVSVDDGRIEQKTHFRGQASFTRDGDPGKFYIWYSDPTSPGDYYYSEPENFGNRDKWIKGKKTWIDRKKMIETLETELICKQLF